MDYLLLCWSFLEDCSHKNLLKLLVIEDALGAEVLESRSMFLLDTSGGLMFQNDVRRLN